MNYRRGLWIVLLASYALRVWLAWGGGQGYWPDELMRYGEARNAAYHLVHGDLHAAAPDLLGRADHQLFRWVALPPAIADVVWGQNAFRSACYFALFSVSAIGLIWWVARRGGASEYEALLAALLAASMSTLFFYARHFFPYDVALCWMLIACGLGIREFNGLRVSFAVGLAAAIGFLCYNGYWLSCGAVMAVHVLAAWPAPRRLFERAFFTAMGFALPVGAIVASGRIAGYDLIALFRANSATITQGDFGIGYRVVVEYLWHAEHCLAVLCLVALAVIAFWALRRDLDRRAVNWLLVVGLVVGGLVGLSDLTPKFVVYGRLVRQLVPFLCLCSAYVLQRWGVGHSGWRVFVGMVAPLVFGIPNFVQPLMQEFPDRFRDRARAAAADYQAREFGIFHLENASHLWAMKLQPLSDGEEVILRASHPLQFRPLQYEGFSAAQRDQLNTRDVAAMRLVSVTRQIVSASLRSRLASDKTLPPVSIRLKLPAGTSGRAEPLLTSGVTGKGDFIYIRYTDSRHIQVGLDHWGGRFIESKPIPVDYAKTHTITLSCPILATFESIGDWPTELRETLNQRLVVRWDGALLINEAAQMHRARNRDVFLGVNYIGGSTTAENFTGVFESVEEASQTELADSFAIRWRSAKSVADRLPRPSSLAGYPGALLLELTLGDPRGGGEPLVTTGVTGGGDFVFIRREDSNHFRIGFDHWGSGGPISEPIEYAPGRPLEILVSMGALYPPTDDDDIRRWEEWRRRLWVIVDGRTVLDQAVEFHPCTPEQIWVGVNPIGGSSAARQLAGALLVQDAVAPEAFFIRTTGP